jgi:hypothetical protein
MKKTIIILILGLASTVAQAQRLTPAQKESDFRFLASLYATYYAPYEWKKQLLGFDLFDIKPWLARVAATETDLDFYEICVEYVASLNDTHDRFSLPSDFIARLPITVDVYDGKVLIETITRTSLPVADYPFVVGDELISIDGKSVEQLLKDYAKYATYGNPIATRRLAATRIVSRVQSLMPHAPDVGESATVVVQRQNGALETYSIKWIKTGTPLEVGPVPVPKTLAEESSAAVKEAAASSDEPRYMRMLNELTWGGVRTEDALNGVLNYGARNPIYLGGLPPAPAFTRRLGGAAADFFYSGIFRYEELTFGYIRIPNYAPASQPTAIQQFQTEIDFMNANTDGLIIDEMRNTGGSLCFGEDIATRLIPYPFRATGFQLRAFWGRLLGFYNALMNAKASGAPQDIIERYETLYKAMADANARASGVTTTIPICTANLDRNPATDAAGNVIAYKKPVLMLIDEFTISTADSVAGMFQDANRGVLYGMRTNGAGGNNTSFDAGPYTEGFTGMTIGLQVRKAPVGTADYPVTAYIENVGVRANVVKDYMTKDNLLQNGAPFVHDFLEAMAAYVRGLR